MIKSELESNIVNNHDEFPKLMKNNQSGCVVLFTDLTSGVIIYSPSDLTYVVGQHSVNWMQANNQEVWTICNDKVILSNDYKTED